MSIRLVRLANGTVQPRVFCDACCEPIDRAGDANFLWDREVPEAVGSSTDVKFAHKRCTRLIDAMADGRSMAANELLVFPGALWRQLGMSDQQAVDEVVQRRGDDPLAVS